MHPNAELITRFYSAFAARDHEMMARSYSDKARFSDPVFPSLDADEVRAMWRMFCVSGNDIAVTFSDVEGGDERGSARWEASYAFPRTGRNVDNKIAASFEFDSGLIVRHVDSFDPLSLDPDGAWPGRGTPGVDPGGPKPGAVPGRRPAGALSKRGNEGR